MFKPIAFDKTTFMPYNDHPNMSLPQTAPALTTNPLPPQDKHEYETFDSFGPHSYLNEYYSKVDYENNELLKFYAEAYQQIPQVGKILEFSGGPTIYSLITAAAKATEIHFSDFLTDNRKEVKRWLTNHKMSFHWDHFIHRALEHEGHQNISDDHLTARKQTIQSKVKKLVKSNAFRKFNLKHNGHSQYDTVSVNFVAESITPKKNEWEKALKNIFSLIKPGGHLILTSLKKSEFYILDGKKFPAVQIIEEDLVQVLRKHHFDMDTLYMRSIDAEPYRGYEGMIFIKIQKSLDSQQ